MPLQFPDYEIPILKALIKLAGSGKTKDVYVVIEDLMHEELAKHPEEYQKYESGALIWKNKARWAREYLKRKNQLDGSQRGVWKITNVGRERFRLFEQTGRDPDEGLAKLHGIQPEMATPDAKPEKVFREQEKIQLHETGDILGVRGIVYEPINEQGVILLFAALAYELDFRIEAIRSAFPDARLRRKNNKSRWIACQAEFEFKSSHFKIHGHDPSQCDIIICWEHDWPECPIEVLSLKDVVKKFKD